MIVARFIGPWNVEVAPVQKKRIKNECIHEICKDKPFMSVL